MRGFVRFIAVLVVLALGGAILLHVVNLQRLGGSTFTAGAEALLERSRAVRELAGPDLEQRILASLPPSSLGGSSYRLDEKLEEATATLDDADATAALRSGVVFGFEFDGSDAVTFETAQDKATIEQADGFLNVVYRGKDFLRNREPLALPRNEISEIVIRARAREATEMRLGWPTTEGGDRLFHYKIAVDVVPGGEFQTYVIAAAGALQGESGAPETISEILFRPSNVEGDEVEIDYIRFMSKLATYQQHPSGVGYETLGKDMRRVLHMLPGQTIEHRLRIPERTPVLDFGAGVLRSGAPLTLSVRIGDAGAATLIFEKTIASAADWEDVRIDLARWAGREVRLRLRVAGAAQNVALWSSPVVYSPPERRFNVIFFMEDTLRNDHLSLSGYSRPTSPVREAMAERAVVFENAIAQATQTRPSVPALMTSLMPTATGVWHRSDALSDRYLTLAELLRSQGFATASFLQNPNAGPYAGLHQGFDTIIDEGLLGQTTEGILGERLDAWVKRNRDRNFFLNVHIIDPHGPYDPPPPWDRWYHELDGGGRSVEFTPHLEPEWLDEPTDLSRVALYDGEIAHNDSLLSGFLSKLEALGLARDTLIVFISDHGEFFGEGGRWGHHPPGLSPVVHVPLTMLFPGRFPDGKSIDERVQLIDVMPTVLELAGIDHASMPLQGDSLVGLIEGRNRDYFESRLVVSEEPTDMLVKGETRGLGSVYAGRWHVISSQRFRPRSERVPQLFRTHVYDLSVDPLEASPAISFRPDLLLKYRFARIVRRLQTTNAETWRAVTGGRTETVAADPAVEERLKALGYLQ